MKECKGCEKEKAISEFYVHKQMGDGHLNFCKECIKERARKRSRSDAGREYDRKRNQTPKRKEWLREYQRKKRAKDIVKTKCYYTFTKAVSGGEVQRAQFCELCGSSKQIQAHHEDYNKPLEVQWLCGKCHRKLHKQFARID